MFLEEKGEEMASKMVQKVQRHNEQILDLVRKAHPWKGKEKPIRFKVPQRFELQKLFDTWFDNGTAEASILFKGNVEVERFVHEWEVLYDGKYSKSSLLLNHITFENVLSQATTQI